MFDTILIFEDEFHCNLFPLTYTRPVFDLRCGILTLQEKIEKRFPDKTILLHFRDYLTGYVSRSNSSDKLNNIDTSIDNCLIINGSIVIDDELIDKLKNISENEVLVKGDKLVAAYVSKNNLSIIRDNLNLPISLSLLNHLPQSEIDAEIINYPWDLVNINGSQISKDFELLVNRNEEQILGKIYEGVHMLNEKDIFIGKGANIKPGAILDAEEGPIHIAENATIYPNTVIQGPTSVGESALIKIGAKIYGDTTIGPVCKISGEIGESILHSYSNKQHNGFLGHAYLGSWVNIGAGTNNSDLKNNYGTVKVTINDIEIDTGEVMSGLIMGDHSKSGINTMFNTGTVVGVSANVFGSGFLDKYIPSFSWGGAESTTTFNIDKAIGVAKTVMSRREIEFVEDDENVLKMIYKFTEKERLKRGMPK